MLERPKRLLVVGVVGASVLGVAAIGHAHGHDKAQAPHAVAHYYGRPLIPGSGSIDKLTRAGNWKVTLYSDNRANFQIIGRDNTAFIDGTMRCLNDYQLDVTAQPVNLPQWPGASAVPKLHETYNGDMAQKACKAGALSIGGLDAVGGIKRIA